MLHALRNTKRNQMKYWILYIIIFGSLINNLCEIDRQGGYAGGFFMMISNPIIGKQLTNQSGVGFWESYSYYFTNIKWKEPLSIIESVVPYFKITGFISRDENEMAFDANGVTQNIQDVTSQTTNVTYNNEMPKQQDESIPLEKYKDYYYILKNFITGDSVLDIDIDLLKQWDFYALMQKKIQIDQSIQGPKILIFHTHAREAYIGGKTVVDVGEALKTVLEKKYHFEVMHVTEEFYAPGNEGGVDGTEYEIMEPCIRKVLEANPSIQVVIDLHRDGISDNVHLVTEMNGKQAAKIMFVNGLCLHRNAEGEIIHKQGLPNPYLEDNLAFSMQAETIGNECYPGLLRKIYCKPYRYSTHMRPNSLVIEIGAQTNTGEEAINSVEPLADILAKVLQKD
ncbi:stage II sporulation protein P [Cellulosilyticum ruminicola]|uniref:stage II sporulation protein P n=1 Tax=Cellulosilyticum ruminicola TaxID=425254 RepID=UPI0006D26B98|nr:stage II sporulation protein P [Cellulosilyticum ruminicola]